MPETTPCIPIERIGDLSDLPEGHPDRIHARDCARCRGLWLSYQSFVRSEPVAGAGPEAARGRMDAFIRKQGEKPVAASESPWRRFFDSLRRPVPAVAAAAIVIVVAVAVLRNDRAADTPRLRDADSPAAATAVAPTVLPDGSVRVTWEAVGDADAYVVRFFASDLSEVFRSGPVRGSLEYVVLADALPDGPAELTCRVYAIRQGDVIHSSPPVLIRLP